MRGTFAVLLAVLISAFPAKSNSTQLNDGAPFDAQTRIAGAEITKDGTVQIRFNNERSIQVPAEKGQAGREHLQIAACGCSVGWLEVDVPVGSYSVPTTLTVYTVGKPLRHLGDGLVLLEWDFIDDDKHIQFSSSQAHGPGTDWLSLEVHDIETGRLLKRWLERSASAANDVDLTVITGRVTGDGGVALPDTVLSIRADPGAEPFALTISDAGGHFALQGIWPGQHELRFEHPGFKTRSVKITTTSSVESVDAGVVTLERQPTPGK